MNHPVFVKVDNLDKLDKSIIFKEKKTYLVHQLAPYLTLSSV